MSEKQSVTIVGCNKVFRLECIQPWGKDPSAPAVVSVKSDDKVKAMLVARDVSAGTVESVSFEFWKVVEGGRSVFFADGETLPAVRTIQRRELTRDVLLGHSPIGDMLELSSRLSDQMFLGL